MVLLHLEKESMKNGGVYRLGFQRSAGSPQASVAEFVQVDCTFCDENGRRCEFSTLSQAVTRVERPRICGLVCGNLAKDAWGAGLAAQATIDHQQDAAAGIAWGAEYIQGQKMPLTNAAVEA
jgi:hypothetical protein